MDRATVSIRIERRGFAPDNKCLEHGPIWPYLANLPCAGDLEDVGIVAGLLGRQFYHQSFCVLSEVQFAPVPDQGDTVDRLYPGCACGQRFYGPCFAGPGQRNRIESFGFGCESNVLPGKGRSLCVCKRTFLDLRRTLPKGMPGTGS